MFGSSRETLDGLELAKWVTGTNGTEIQVDRDKAVAYVKSLADKYDTYGNHKYKTTSGRDVVVYGKYGWKINQTAETDALVEAVKACQTTEREPIYESRGAMVMISDRLISRWILPHSISISIKMEK